MINPRTAFYAATASITVLNRILIIYDNYHQRKAREQMQANMFRTLTDEEEATFRKWARKNYRPFTDIQSIWHPVVQHECAVMNMERLKDPEDASTTM